jgi:hypothetical protein
MQSPTRFPAIMAAALLLAVLYGCSKPDDQPSPASAPDTNHWAAKDVFTARVKHRVVGTFVLPDGSFYEGDLANASLPDGQGRLASQNGTDQRGEWRDGEAYRLTGTWVAVDGTREVGTWNRDGSRSGGTIYWTNGRKYAGDWQIADGRPEVPDGNGVMTLPDGRVYTGQFRNGEMDGRGKMTWPDGKVQDGSWQHGQFLGPTP